MDIVPAFNHLPRFSPANNWCSDAFTGSDLKHIIETIPSYELWRANPFLLQTLQPDLVQQNEANKYPKRSAYIIAIISKDAFISLGAHLLSSGVYYIPKDYKGTPENETSALLGVSRNFFSDLIKGDNSTLIINLRKENVLAHIPGIEKLTCFYVSDILDKFSRFLSTCEHNEIIMINIEPMGSGRLKRCYPEARLTIPGGTMDDIDNHSFEMCGLREFREETGIDIRLCHREITRHKVKKYNKKKKWFKHVERTLPPPGLGYDKKVKDQLHSISMYFLVRIQQL